MSTGLEQTHASRPTKPHRVLACVLCQQRKIRCDRTFPCSNCTKSRAQCVPATLMPRQRRRRFPEKDLLARLRYYEGLLREHKIEFEPLHPETAKDKSSPPDVHIDDSSEDVQSPAAKTDISQASSSSQPEKTFVAKSFWRAMNAGFRSTGDDSDSSDDGFKYAAVHETWDKVHQYNGHLLFGAQTPDIDLSPFQPDTLHIFRLWQIYLDNVNPLLKVTHTPSLQGRIIEAASNPTGISHDLEALMFSIYCMAVTSLSGEDCESIFGSPRRDLLTKFQFGCQQALEKCEFLRTSSRDCLTALYLYLLSTLELTDPRSMSSILGVAVRIAQRMGLYSETENCTQNFLEAEIRRRVWWSLILFDARICEMSNHRSGTLLPTWDCGVPSNINDSDMRSEMKAHPTSQGNPTEAIFAVVRAELGRFIRRMNFHLDFTNPALKQLAPIDRLSQQLGATSLSDGGSELDELEQYIEEKYLRFCDEENPLHYMTIWYTRGYIARSRLVEFYSKCSPQPSDTPTSGQSSQSSQKQPTEAQRDAAFNNALDMLTYDTKVMSHPLTQGYLWLMDHNFPVIAYFQAVQVLRRRPMSDQAERAWQIMDENFEARFNKRAIKRGYFGAERGNPLIEFFAKVILGAWASREMAHVTQTPLGEDLPPTPRIVMGLRKLMAEKKLKTKGEPPSSDMNFASPGGSDNLYTGFGGGDADISMTMDFNNNPALAPYAGGLFNYAAPLQSDLNVGMPSQQTSFDMGMYPLDFSNMYATEKPDGPW